MIPLNPSGLCMCGCGERTTLASRSYTKRNIIKGQPFRYIAGHQRRLTTPPYVERDWGYETPCWVWQRSTTQGYGRKGAGASRSVPAHRFYWERENGPVPAGLQLDHLCRNHPCVRPSHLEPVTSTENVRRGAHTRLTKGDVLYIRDSVHQGQTQTSLAREFGVCKATINHIITGRNWRDVR